MIYTVTFNPAIDYVVELVSFNIGEINRTTREYMNLGGKGVNVSRDLKKFKKIVDKNFSIWYSKGALEIRKVH